MSKMRAWTLRLIALAWLAIFMMAVAPTLAGMVAPVTRDALIQICTPLGIQFVPDPSIDPSEDAPAPDGLTGNCPLCVTPGAHALPTEAVSTPDIAPHGAEHEHPRHEPDTPTGRLAHTAHRPRAPPTSL